jgi:hypothetical protein
MSRQDVFSILRPVGGWPGVASAGIAPVTAGDEFVSEFVPSGRQNDSSQNTGELTLFGWDGTPTASLSGSGRAFVGGNGVDGRLTMATAEGKPGLYAGLENNQALLILGGESLAGYIMLYSDDGTVGLLLDGRNGDISLGGADCAEEFSVDEEVVPGSVVSIGPSGRLALTQTAYDPTAVGVVSGRGRYRPALVLDATRKPPGERRLPLALMGRVVCLLDPDAGPVRRGDLLTSSDRPGHAMAANDHDRAFGSVIGKALADVPAGAREGEILVFNR